MEYSYSVENDLNPNKHTRFQILLGKHHKKRFQAILKAYMIHKIQRKFKGFHDKFQPFILIGYAHAIKEQKVNSTGKRKVRKLINVQDVISQYRVENHPKINNSYMYDYLIVKSILPKRFIPH